MEKSSSSRRERNTVLLFSFHTVHELGIAYVLHTISCIEIPLYIVVAPFQFIFTHKIFPLYQFTSFFIRLVNSTTIGIYLERKTEFRFGIEFYAKIWIFLHVYIVFLSLLSISSCVGLCIFLPGFSGFILLQTRNIDLGCPRYIYIYSMHLILLYNYFVYI